MTTGTGKIELEIPRDRAGSFDPALIAKYRRRFPDFDDEIVSMYARGMSTGEIAGHIRKLYGVDVSADLISAVTDAVLEELAAWQTRPLEAVYPRVFFDALRVKIRTKARSETRPSTSLWACARTVPRRCLASGSSRTRAPSSGSGP